MTKMKLLCLPYAGASASVYEKWSRYLNENIELYQIELVGRGKRNKESFYNSISEAVDDIYEIIKKDLDNFQFAIFGHSMGSILAYELYYKLISENRRIPLHIFFSGKEALHIEKEHSNIHNATFEVLKSEILNLGGTPSMLFDEPELRDLFIPIIRADYKIIETYKYMKRPEKIRSNITIFHGDNDETVSSDISEWKFHAVNQCKIHKFSGGHFFINDYMREIVNIINSTLIYEISNKNESI